MNRDEDPYKPSYSHLQSHASPYPFDVDPSLTPKPGFNRPNHYSNDDPQTSYLHLESYPLFPGDAQVMRRN